MRVAALYDIHANLPALEAVLYELESLEIDRIVIGGDMIPGPMPAEVFDKVLGLGIPTDFILGNCEVETIEVLAGHRPKSVAERLLPAFKWAANRLKPEHKTAIEAWPLSKTVAVRGFGDVLFCHATPSSVHDIFTAQTDEARLRPIFDDLEVKTVVCGHTHMQFDRRVGGTRILNAGSVGSPFGTPGAYWLLFDPGPELRRTDYDYEGAAERVGATDYPGAAEFAERVLAPQAAEEMVALFSQFELGSETR